MPIIYILSGSTDIAYANGVDDYARIKGVPKVLVNLPAGHGGTFPKPNGAAAAQVAVAWLHWTLTGSAMAARRLKGADGGLCKRLDVSIGSSGL